MKLLKIEDVDLDKITKRSKQDINEVIPTVNNIIADVQKNKDKALKEYTEKFDSVKLDDLRVKKEEINEAYSNIDSGLLDSLKLALKNIEKFHKKEIPKEWDMEVTDGVKAGQIIRPISSVGCYIPGGRAIYPSTILMTVIPAKIAGVERIIATTPPQKDGKIADAILVAADLSGADEIYKVGGAQAIAAMAYGTKTITPVEKIIGPGNVFVTAAKKLVFGDVDIDFPAGPSEILILADESANPEFIAYDILAQGEHDPNASCFLVTNSEEIATKTLEEVNQKIPEAKRREIIEESLGSRGYIILTNTIEEALNITNEYAPEHLIIMTKDNTKILSNIKNAGSIFLGDYSPVACGDYGSGTNHVLPTGGGAKMCSGLSTESFIKKPTVQTISYEGLENLYSTCVPIAEYEGFFAHADSIKVRLDKK